MSSYCITTWNVHGLTSSKVESLRSFLKEKQPLAVVLTETHRASASPAEWPRFHGYSVFPLPGQSNRSGGLAFLLRADRIAWGGPEDCSIMVGLNISGRSTKMPDTTSQWAALKLQLHGHKQPIWLVGVYLQPPVTAAVQAEFVKQLHQTVSSHELIASMPNIRRHQLVPQLVLCGDFNTHDASLCAADDHLHSDFLDSILQMGFRCANAPRADAHTHSSGSVLDLFFELAHPATPPLLRSVVVDNTARRIHLPGSDHFAVTAGLYCQVAQLPPAHTFYKWRTDSLTEEAAAAFTAHLERICKGAPLQNQERLENPLAQTVLAAFTELCSFKVGGINGVSPVRHKNKAQSLANAAWTALSSTLHALAAEHIGQRQRNSTEEKGWTEQLHHLYKAMLRAEGDWRRQRTDTQLMERRQAAQTAFRDALTTRQKERWDELRSAVEEAPPQRRSRVAWQSFGKYRKAKEFSQTVGAGIIRPDGTPTTTEADSRAALAIHFRQQMTAHTSKEEEKAVDTHECDYELQLGAAPPVNRTVQALQPADKLTTEADFRTVLSRTNTKTAAGPDELNGAIIRLAAQSDAFMHCITALVNFCYAFHVLPQGWKDANLMPLLKKNGDPRSRGSYRPISITSLLMRRVERLMEARVKDKLDKQLSPWQAGFRRCRSTRQQVLYLQHRIAAATRRSASHRAVPYPVVFLDNSRAFDSVPHKFLLHKLHKLGVRGHDLHFFAAYLSGRRFRLVTLNGIDECWNKVEAGVPQGGVLSPLLYAVFIDDCHNHSSMANSRAFVNRYGQLLYADDIAVAPSEDQDVVHRHKQLQTALTTLGRWAQRWGVRFNAAKSGVLWFYKTGTKKATLTAAQALPPLTIEHADGQPAIELPVVEEYQYLGVWLNAKLTAHSHFRHLMAKCAPMSALLRGVQSPKAPPGPDIVRALVRALLLSSINYGLPFFTPTKQMCARLDSLIFRPMLTALALPPSVHRASLAVYTQLPVVQLQRDRELMALFGSILRLVNEPAFRSQPLTLPVFKLLLDLCNKETATARIERFYSRPCHLRYNDWDQRSPVDRFFQAAAYLGMHALLPTVAMITAQNSPACHWDYKNWKAKLAQAIRVRSIERVLNESRGYVYSYRGWRFGRIASVFPSEDHKYGTELTLLLGIPLQPPQQRQLPGLELLDHAVELSQPNQCFSAHTLGEDRKRHAQLRARIALNRSAFNAVRAHRSKDPLAPRRCRQCPATPLETARHVLVSCPRYAASRDELKKKLNALIERIRKAKDHSSKWRRCIQDDNELLFHVILATPFVLSVLKKADDRAQLLRCTGDFLLDVHDIRPT